MRPVSCCPYDLRDAVPPDDESTGVGETGHDPEACEAAVVDGEDGRGEVEVGGEGLHDGGAVEAHIVADEVEGSIPV